MKNHRLVLDLSLRFILGGSAVAGCYLVLMIIPWKSFAGIFAAFPAVLASAIIMAGWLEGSHSASELSLGATAGMLGCTVCVIASLLGMLSGLDWIDSIIIALAAWLLSSLFFIALINRWR